MTKKEQRILVGLALVVIVVFGGLAYLILSLPPMSEVSALPPSAAGPSSLNEDVVFLTAREAQDLAQPMASSWQGDARLLSASGDWRDAGREGLDEGKSRAWGVYFLSPAARKVYAISVDHRTPMGLREIAVPSDVSLNPASLSTWAVDSPAAIETWLANGGADYLAQHPGVTVNATLRFPGDGSNPVWKIVGSSEGQGPNFYLEIDAATGAVRD